MADNIQKVMDLGCCDRDEAIELLSKSGNDVLEAVSLKMNIPPGRDAPKPRDLSMIQQFFKTTRQEMTTLTNSISKGFISDQSAPSEHSETQNLPEETAQQSNCYSGCHPLAPSLEVQIPEIAYQSPSECSSDLPLNDQILPGSALECHRWFPSPEKALSEKDAETTASGP
jgi:hypothetical protein